MAAPAPDAIAAAKLTCATASRVIDIIRRPLVILDDKLRVVFSNRAFCRAFATSQDEIVGRHVMTIGDRCLDVAGFRGFLGLLEAGGAVVEDYEIEVESPALGSRVLLLSGQKIYDDPTAPRETLVLIEDVTERRRAEMTLIAEKWQADRASLGKSRILAAASHNLRQPLQTLNLMRAALAKNIKGDEGSDLIRQLNKTTDSMLDMLDTLLDINRLEAGIVSSKEVEFPINDLLEQLRIEFTYHAQARGLGWHVVPCRLSIWSDPHLLGQMLRNLLSNAMKYTERGKILLGCRQRGDMLRIEVWDTGIGIPEEQLHAIFAEFHQPGNPAHDRALGFGLGLPIVQRLGHALGHSIDVHSHLGKGSVFAIEVPLGAGQRKAPVAHHRSGTTPAAGDRATTWTAAPSQGDVKDRVPRPTIFVVDDEGALRDAMRELLEADGWAVEAYPSGETFLGAYHADREGCLVVDARMPGMSGLELLERLKAGNGRPPAIMLTGHADVRLAVRAMRAGAMAFLEKPVEYGDLVANIERALNLTRNSTALWSLREAATKRMASLTLRERQVVEMVVKGNPNKQIAYALGISQRTVETHRATAMRKVGVRSLSELIHLTIARSPQGT